MMESAAKAIAALTIGMREPLSEHPHAVDRQSVAAFLRRAIAAADAAPRAALHARSASPAGIALDLWFDDEAAAELYSARLAVAPVPADQAPIRLHVLSRCQALPSWNDPACDAAELHMLLDKAGLRAAYPFRPHLWLALDRDSGIGVQLARAPEDLPDWHAGAPLRQHLHWLLRARGQRLAHAASLGRAGRGILLLGHGGAGKSGATLAGLAAGLQTVGDDYIALGDLQPARARPLFRVVKQDRAGLARLPGLIEHTAGLRENWKGKVEFDPAAIFPGCFADCIEIHAIVLPHVALAPQPRFVEIGAGDAMRSLMRSNLFQFPGEPEDGMEYYAELLRSLPVHRLDLSADATANGAALAEFLGRLR